MEEGTHPGQSMTGRWAEDDEEWTGLVRCRVESGSVQVCDLPEANAKSEDEEETAAAEETA